MTDKATEKKATEDKTKTTDNKKAEPTKDAKLKPVVEDEDLSDDDRALKEELLLCVERLKETNESLYKPALEILRSRIKESTSSMTSVPKPLKFLRSSYESLKQSYEKILDTKTKSFCADIVSVLGMTISEKRECLKYRFLSSKEDVGSWGHEYVRHLTAELTEEWNEMDKQASKQKEADTTTTTSTTDGFTVIATEDVELDIEPVVVISKADLLALTKEIVTFYMSHNAEAEACDLLMEIEHVELLIDYTEKDTYQRVCLYLLGKLDDVIYFAERRLKLVQF